MMSYDDVYQIIGLYCGDVLPVFADRWSRFPVCTSATTVANRLNNAAASWARVNADIAASLAAAASTVMHYGGHSTDGSNADANA